MLDADSMAALLEAFSAETAEGLADAEEALLHLERSPEDEESVGTVFRAAHTIKGNAAIFDLGPVCELTHVMEDLLDQVRSSAVSVTDTLVTVLLDAVDLIRRQVPECIEGRESLNSDERLVMERMRELSAGPGSSPTVQTIVGDTKTIARRETSIRVDLATLDKLLDLTGEIGIARGRVTGLVSDPSVSRSLILEAQQEAGRLHVEMQELVMKLRMIPVSRTFRQFHRTVRDLARSVGKAAELELAGEDVAVDMTIMENLRDPLVHMIRNSIDHGIESPEQRTAAGKDPVGRLVLRSSREAGSIVIELEDDGRGLDRARIVSHARRAGMVSPDQTLSDEEIDQLIFRAGFSTADAVTDLSGRGVGMDVVRRNIESIQGSISILTSPGKGTTIRLRLPLTLAIVDGLLVEVAGEPYIIPMETVVEVLEMSRFDESCAAGDLVDFRGRTIPFVRLSTHLTSQTRAIPGRENLVIVRNGATLTGLVVDEVTGECQTVVKPLAKILQGLPGFSGSSILPNGRIAFIIDLPTLLPTVKKQPERLVPAATERDHGIAAGLHTNTSTRS